MPGPTHPNRMDVIYAQRVARAVLEASGAVPVAEHERLLALENGDWKARYSDASRQVERLCEERDDLVRTAMRQSEARFAAEAELERVKGALTALVGAYRYTHSEPPACVKNALVAAEAALSAGAVGEGPQAVPTVDSGEAPGG